MSELSDVVMKAIERDDYEFAAELVIRDFFIRKMREEGASELEVMEKLLAGHYYDGEREEEE